MNKKIDRVAAVENHPTVALEMPVLQVKHGSEVARSSLAITHHPLHLDESIDGDLDFFVETHLFFLPSMTLNGL